MKKKNIIIIVLILVIVLQFIWIAYVSITNPRWDNVHISIEEGSLTPIGVTLIIKNKNLITTNYSFADNFYIDKNVNGQWINIPDKSTINNDLPLVYTPHNYKETLNWKYSHGELKTGTYRIRFEPKSYNDNFPFGTTLKIEFTLSDTNNSKSDNWIIKEVEIGNEVSTDLAIIPKWEEMTISEQFREAEYNNNQYSSRITKISSDNILQKIGDSILTGYDSYTKTTYSKKGEIYSIKDLSEKCVVGVKFEGDADYYVYVNTYYRPTTLGEFMNDLKLEEITSFGTVHYNYWEENSEGDMQYKMIEFYNVDNKLIWQKLFDNLNLENIYSDLENYTSEKYAQSISIAVNIPLLGYKNISVSLTDKGYLITNILATGKGFYIGEAKVQKFLECIKENYDGYEIVYVYKEENNIENGEDKIIEVENKSKEENIVID